MIKNVAAYDTNQIGIPNVNGTFTIRVAKAITTVTNILLRLEKKNTLILLHMFV